MKSMKCFFLILVLIAGLCAPSLAVYAEAVQEEPKSFTEGADTAVTITSYTDFDEEGIYFLKEGDQIAVISPSALPSKRQVEMTVEGLKSWGYVPVEGQYVAVEERTLEECIEDLTWALNDPEIKAIFCVRGGHASSEVLDHFQLSMIKNAKKPIIGCSDISTYLSAWTVSGLPSIHASMSGCFTGGMPADCSEATRA